VHGFLQIPDRGRRIGTRFEAGEHGGVAFLAGDALAYARYRQIQEIGDEGQQQSPGD
jgi:hypothetical protein